MSINLTFGNYHHFRLNETRITSMVQADEKSATHLSLWDKVKDYFRTDKKREACRELYHLLHATESCDLLDTFNKLKGLAHPECQVRFTKEIDGNEVLFRIGNETIVRSSLQRLMSLSEDTPLYPMSLSEQDLFLDMLDTLREKERIFSDYSASYLRKRMANLLSHRLLNLYRPQESIDTIGIQWNNPETLDDKEKDLLRGLNRGSMKPFSEYSFIGYQKTTFGVEFSMLHPSINYLLSSYSRVIEESSIIMDLNVSYVKCLNKTYENYHHQKNKIDEVLKKVYDAHGETLNISYRTISNNNVVDPPDDDIEYIFQSDNILSDLDRSIHSIFRKWTKSDHISPNT